MCPAGTLVSTILLVGLQPAEDAAGVTAGQAALWNCSRSGGQEVREVKEEQKRWNLASSLGGVRHSFWLAVKKTSVPQLSGRRSRSTFLPGQIYWRLCALLHV